MLSNLPQEFRDKIGGEIKKGIARDAHKHGNESEAGFEARMKITEKVGPHILRTLDELDQVVFGWGIDRASEKTFFDVSVTAKAGSQTAKEIAESTKATTAFSGFRSPTAAMSGTVAGTLTPTKKDVLTTIIGAGRAAALKDSEAKTPADKQKLAKSLINGIGDLLMKVVEGGHIDGAATVLINPKAATGMLAGYVGDGAELDKILHIVYGAIEHDNPNVADLVKFDADKASAVSFHKITIPIPAGGHDSEKAMKLLGENLEIVIGIGKENAYVAAGRDALSTLKKAIQASATVGKKESLPVDVKVSTQAVMSFAAEMGQPKDRPGAAAAAAELKKTPGKDHITLVARPVPNGVQYHLEVEQGIVRAAGHLIANAQRQ